MFWPFLGYITRSAYVALQYLLRVASLIVLQQITAQLQALENTSQ